MYSQLDLKTPDGFGYIISIDCSLLYKLQSLFHLKN